MRMGMVCPTGGNFSPVPIRTTMMVGRIRILTGEPICRPTSLDSRGFVGWTPTATGCLTAGSWLMD